MLNALSGLSDTSVSLLSLAVILLSGFLVTRLTKLLHLPNVSGFILAGVLIGPAVLNIVPKGFVTKLSFISDVALAFIAFGVGKFFKREVISEAGGKTIIITLFEALLAGAAVTLAMHFIFKMNLEFSLLMGTMATATAPSSTMMTIDQYHARGRFVNTLLQVVALDNVICIFAWSIVTSIVSARYSGDVSIATMNMPIVYNLGMIIFGFACGFVLSKLLTPKRSDDNRLILAVAMLLGIAGLCAMLNISPLLSCMVFGAAYINLTEDKRLYKQINGFTPPIMSTFFIVSGMSLDLSTLKVVGLIGISYFVIRIAAKYSGAYLGAVISRETKAVRYLLGIALVPQAGVTIGLAFLGQRILPPEIGNLLLTIILASSVLYEFVGPVCGKIAISKAGEIEE